MWNTDSLFPALLRTLCPCLLSYAHHTLRAVHQMQMKLFFKNVVSVCVEPLQQLLCGDSFLDVWGCRFFTGCCVNGTSVTNPTSQALVENLQQQVNKPKVFSGSLCICANVRNASFIVLFQQVSPTCTIGSTALTEHCMTEPLFTHDSLIPRFAALWHQLYWFFMFLDELGFAIMWSNERKETGCARYTHFFTHELKHKQRDGWVI